METANRKNSDGKTLSDVKATDQFAAKLALRCVGLHTVNSYVSPVIVTLKGDCTNRTAHIFDLKPVKAGTTTSTHVD